MTPVGMLLFSLIASVIAVALWKLFWLIYHEFTSPLRHLPGPEATNLVYGNMGDIWETSLLFVQESVYLQEKWVEEYGNTLRYKGFFCPIYVRHAIAKILGKGEIVRHPASDPAFGPAQIRALTGIFFAKAIQLRDVLTSEISKNPAVHTNGACIDIVPWLNKVTLDIIGLAGFNYNINALNTNEIPNELNEAFSAVTPTDDLHKIQVAHRTMRRIGRELLTNAKAAARAGAKETGEIDKSSIHGRDLFSQLVKANMATDIPESQKLSDED
ncbi:hypothetical protein BU15DRAFT_69580, partial [Melanogaster broomeanus]